MSNTIKLISNGRHEENLAGEALSPGHLIIRKSTGKMSKHDAEGAVCERAFALEDALQGRAIETAYALDEKVSYLLAHPGDEVQCFLKAGSTAVIGTQLMSAGDGTLIPIADVSSGVTVADIVGVAQEALDLSASGAVDTLIDIRVL